MFLRDIIVYGKLYGELSAINAGYTGEGEELCAKEGEKHLGNILFLNVFR